MENVAEDETEDYSHGVPDASKAADNLSIEPGRQLAEDTHGHGCLANTRPGILNSHSKGALPV